jgi:2',3'-cyclic-nucleotide 2'-phosphodiesterase/3'-nucleotidase
LTFVDAYRAIKTEVECLRPHVDLIVVLYHGGFEADLATGKPVGRQTDENQGYLISTIPGIDLLLTGHQHVPTVRVKDGIHLLQTSFSARDVGVAKVAFDQTCVHVECHLHRLTEREDAVLVETLRDDEEATRSWLDAYLGETDQDMTIKDPLSCRRTKHPLFQLINDIQRKHTGADLSCASLPNHPPGFQKRINRRDVAANFVYPNTIFVLKITGRILKAALERSAEYFEWNDGNVTIAESFLKPKLEHYNYDVYDGIEYVFDVRRPKGSRVIRLTRHGQSIREEDTFTLALNNYRAAGGGDYAMFEQAAVLKEFDQPLSDWIAEAISSQPRLHIDIQDNFIVY